MSDTTVTLTTSRVDPETGEVIEKTTGPVTEQQFHDGVDRIVNGAHAATADGDEPGIPSDEAFEDELTDFLPAAMLTEITDRLVREVESLRWLKHIRIRCLWQREHGEEPGGVKIVKGLLKPGYPKTDFLVWVAADYARVSTPQQVEAALMHQLCHIGMTEKGKFALRKHDIGEFRAVAQQFGMVTPDLRAFGDTFRQLNLLPFAHESLHDLRHGGGR